MNTSHFEVLRDKIETGTCHICVVGLGYVGLPLAMEMAAVGYHVVGLETSTERAGMIRDGHSYINDVPGERIAQLVSAGRLDATTDYAALKDVDVVFICVPTPFTEVRAPDLCFIRTASEGIAKHLHPGQLVILQSTTYPGTTEEVVLPILEETGLKGGSDFWLAFSPERINPGDAVYNVRNTPKVVGGLTQQCAELAQALLERLTAEVFVVSSTRAAEMTKLLENIFRSVNIALVNELALLSERMGIDLWEVIAAASTKPFGFMPFYPGPGVGGHCIPVDPYYLSWKSREYDFQTKFIELAAGVNEDMPYHVVDKITEGLNRQGKCLREARVLLLGVAFKPNVDDARNSPAERVIELLMGHGADVRYNDPHIPRFRVGHNVFMRREMVLESVDLSAGELQNADCVVIVSPHSAYDWPWVVEHAPLVVDTCNATRVVPSDRDKIVRLGAPCE